MTIDKTGSVLRRAGRGSIILTAIVVGWFSTLAGAMLVTEAAPAALVIAPDIRFLGGMPDDIKLLRNGNQVFVLTSESPGYVGRIYEAGAWLVLPALRNGCLDLKALNRSPRSNTQEK